jgi:hypothetical protein
MLKFTTAACLALLAPTASSAGIRGVTADGTWDCPDSSGTYLGAIVLADETYAFIKPDGLFGSYGTLFRNSADLDLPAFSVVDGDLKDVLGAPALALLGPRENTLDFTGELFLYLVIDDVTSFQCVRRVRPGA